MAYKKLYDFLNTEGTKHFESVRRTNHFVVLKVSHDTYHGDIIDKIKRVDQVKFYKVENGQIWIRIKGGLNSFMGKLNGELKIDDFDKFDKELWIWYVENETPFRYRWMIMFIGFFFGNRW